MRRVILKMSGEAIADPTGEQVVDPTRLNSFASQVVEAVVELGDELQIGVVVGGGNIARGKELRMRNRTRADHIGMLATLINGLALQDALEGHGLETRVMTGLEVPKVAEPHIYGRAIKHLSLGRVVIFAGGTGDPYQTTDATAALRACEVHADVLLFAKYRTRGVYTDDPKLNNQAEQFKTMSYSDVLVRNLQVMDLKALTQCSDELIPIYVFDMHADGAVREALLGRHHAGVDGGTMISAGLPVEMWEIRQHGGE